MEFPLLTLAGVVLLGLLCIDIFRTIIHIGGGGFFSRRLADWAWKLAIKLSGKNPHAKILDYAGSIILVVLILAWLLWLWLALSLVYLADTGSVVVTNSGRQASIVGKIYFVGYTLTSLGNGDLKSGSDAWRIVTNLTGITSLFIVSLSISYLLPVLQAAVTKRTLASYIYRMGRSPWEILTNCHAADSFSMLYNRVTNLETMILQHTEQHFAYPILHSFHATDPASSAELNLATLDEALSVLLVFELDDPGQRGQVMVVRRAIGAFLDRYRAMYLDADNAPPPFTYDQDPPWPRDLFIGPAQSSRLDELSERRSTLLASIEQHGWKWEDVTEPEAKES
jgi:hypothetical protein